MTAEKRGKADLHVHTSFSDGMAGARELLDYVEAHTDLDVLAITDHDDIRGALQARDIWARGSYRFGLVTGAELTTIEGHLLALFVDEPLPNLCHMEKALEAIHKLGGVAVAPHPMNPFTRSLGARELRRAQGLHGIEAASCSPGGAMRRAKALALNRELRLAEVGGSDAHFLDFIAGAYTSFQGSTPAELKQAILNGETAAMDGRRPSLREIGVRRLALQTARGIMTTPRRMGWGPTAGSFVRRIFGAR